MKYVLLFMLVFLAAQNASVQNVVSQEIDVPIQENVQHNVQQRLDDIDAKLNEIGQQEKQTWLQYLISHNWVDPATFYGVLCLTAFGFYRFQRAKNERRYEYVTYVLNVPLRCSDGRELPARLTDADKSIIATHGLITGILREDKLESALDKQQLRQLDEAVRKATPAGFLPIDHDMFAMFRTEISEIFNQFVMNWERKANTYECADFREMYYSVMYENFTERKHVRVLVVPKDRLDDLPQNPAQDKSTILRSKKMISRLPNLRFMRDEMQRVESGEVELSPYVRKFEIMDQRQPS